MNVDFTDSESEPVDGDAVESKLNGHQNRVWSHCEDQGPESMRCESCIFLSCLLQVTTNCF